MPDVHTSDDQPACRIVLTAVLTGDRDAALEQFYELVQHDDFLQTATVTEHASQADGEVDPEILIDPAAFRAHFEDREFNTDDEQAAIDAATDLEIAEALSHGFDGDFFWQVFDECFGAAKRRLVEIVKERDA